MNQQRIKSYIDALWESSITPALCDYIRIPNKSPAFDADWQAHGHMERAVTLARDWCLAHAPKDASIEIVRLEGRTPLLFVEVPGSGDDTVLLYGHLDKQPEFDGWRDGLGPWTPVIRDGRLYGRGGADDGYAVFSSLTAINALQQEGIPHPRCVLVIECCEESGSYDLPFYVEHLSARIGSPKLVICLDSECGDYERLWLTTSLRGMVIGTLSVRVLEEGVHSGAATGIVPSSFRVMRQLLARIEDATSGAILVDGFACDIPDDRSREAVATGVVLGASVFGKFPACDGLNPVDGRIEEQLLNFTWRPGLAVTGAGGLPDVSSAGNVMRPGTSLVLSLRTAPLADSEAAAAALKECLEAEPPYGAHVHFDLESHASGWNAPATAPWLEAALAEASLACFDNRHEFVGCGGSIPFIDYLGKRYPDTQFFVTGVLGPASNAHGPNEFLHLDMARRLTAAVALVLARSIE